MADSLPDAAAAADPGNAKYIGLGLAISSSLAIGTSFIITKKGLIDAADKGGYSYLRNGIWWAGMSTMIVGEVANFAAYTMASPTLVAPLGALSVLIGAVLASFFLNETLGKIGRAGCMLCVVGTLMIVLHAPEDKDVETIDELLAYAMAPGFIFYSMLVTGFSLFMIYHVAPKHGTRHPLVYISICSVVGSISVMAIKGVGVALKLTLAGNNQLWRPGTWVFLGIVVGCIGVQMNYFNKALDLFSAQIVQPIYFVTFTTAVIVASVILFQGLNSPSAMNTISLLAGFLTIAIGVYLLNVSRQDPDGVNGGYRAPGERSGRHSMFETGILNPRLSLSGPRLSSGGSDNGGYGIIGNPASSSHPLRSPEGARGAGQAGYRNPSSHHYQQDGRSETLFDSGDGVGLHRLGEEDELDLDDDDDDDSEFDERRRLQGGGGGKVPLVNGGGLP